MLSEIFMEDFERTEYSDYLHGVIGRSLIVATRFDSMCVTLSMAIELKRETISSKISEEDFDDIVSKVISKDRSLNNSILSLKQSNEISSILHSARNARNEIAHSLAKGLEGCIDIKVNETDFIKEVSGLITKISDGDLMVSLLLLSFNNEPFPNSEFLLSYKDSIVNWVIKR